MSCFLAFSVQQKVDCVTWYTKTNSITSTQRIYRRTHQESPPSRNSILRWVHNFREHGTVEIQSRSGRPSMTSEDERRMSNYFNRPTRTSLRTAEIRLGLPRSSIQRVLRNRLHLFPDRLQIVQELEDRDYEARIAFSNWFIEKIELDASYLNRVIFSDECVFHVDGKLNKHNLRIWVSENPHETRKVSRDSAKPTVYRTRCPNLTQLKRKITSTIRNIPTDMLQNVWQNMQNRFSAVLRENGGHI